jgi:hypothetical protein
MSEHESHEDDTHPHEETLPDGAPTAGEAAIERKGNEFHGEKAGKGGDETHGAGEHDDPNN